MRGLLLFSFMVGVAPCVRGGDLALTLLAGAGPHEAGRTLRLDLVALNPGVHEEPFVAEPALAGTLALGERRRAVTLTAVEAASVAVAPGSFAVRRYELELPGDFAGDAVLTVSPAHGDPLRMVLRLGPGVVRPERASAAVAASPIERLAGAAPAATALARNFSGRFLPNQPIYFLYGDAEQAAKFQFSFDYRLATLWRGEGSGTLRLGYTQRSVWDLDGDSSPFYDTSYLPELAYSDDRPMPAVRSPAFTWLGWRVALQHESNGKEGADSRSLNTLYFRPRFVLGTLGRWAFVMLPEIQACLGRSSDNPEIGDFRGYGKLRFYFGHNEGPSLMFTGWLGKAFDRGTWQLDLAVPLRLRWLGVESYFYVQYFDGYGESLRDYKRRSDALRAGFALVR